MSLQSCVSVSVLVGLYDQLNEVDRVSSLSLKCISVSVVKLAGGAKDYQPEGQPSTGLPCPVKARSYKVFFVCL